MNTTYFISVLHYNKYNKNILKVLLDLLDIWSMLLDKHFTTVEDNIGGQKLVISQNILLLILLFKIN